MQVSRRVEFKEVFRRSVRGDQVLSMVRRLQLPLVVGHYRSLSRHQLQSSHDDE